MVRDLVPIVILAVWGLLSLGVAVGLLLAGRRSAGRRGPPVAP